MSADIDFTIVLSAVHRMIEVHRAANSPSDIVDIATGMMCLAERDRRDAIIELCRSAIEREAKPLLEALIERTADQLNSAAFLDAAILAIGLCGADEARALFPVDY